jgi:hypothetical protein
MNHSQPDFLRKKRFSLSLSVLVNTTLFFHIEGKGFAMSIKKIIASAIALSAIGLAAAPVSAQVIPNDIISIQTEGCLRAPLAPSPANAARLRVTDTEANRSYVWSFWYEPCVANAPGTTAYPYDSFLVFSVRPEQAFALDREQIERVELLVSQNGTNPQRTVRQFAYTTYEPLSFEYTGILSKGVLGFYNPNNTTSMLLDDSFTAAVTVPKRVGAAPRASAPAQTNNGESALGVNGMYMNDSESGWGLSVSQSPASNQLFVTWYTYDDDGKQQWLVMPGGFWTAPDVFGGTVYKTKSGKGGFSGKFDASKVELTPVGRGSVSFGVNGAARLNYIGSDGVNRSTTVNKMQF